MIIEKNNYCFMKYINAILAILSTKQKTKDKKKKKSPTKGVTTQKHILSDDHFTVSFMHI